MKSADSNPFVERSSEILRQLEESGQLKHLRLIESPMGPAGPSRLPR